MLKKYWNELTIASVFTLGVVCSFLIFHPFKQNLDANDSADPSIQKLQIDINNLVENYEQYGYRFGIKICSTDDNQILFAKNENEPFVPASNLKLMPSAVALENLGDDYRWETKFYANGKIQNQTLYGDLILKAEGDPTLSSRFLNKEPQSLFKIWADKLKKIGICSIKGNLIIDNSAFSDSNIGQGWKDVYEQAYYASLPSAFSINENCVRITVKGSSRSGYGTTVNVFPSKGDVKIVNSSVTSKRSREYLSINRANDSNTYYIRGSIPRNKLVGRIINLSQPVEYASKVLSDAFDNSNLKIEGDLKISNAALDYSGANLVYTYESFPLNDVLIKTNKHSNNYLANQIYLTLGYKIKNNSAQSEQVIHDFFNLINVDSEYLKIDDGSGLSPLNITTPNQFSEILLHMSHSENFNAFYNSFPVAGVDGTLKGVMHFEPLYKNVRGKTGTIDNVKSLCGYIHSKDNELLTFTILVNYSDATRSKLYQFNNELLVILGNFSRNTNAYQVSLPSDSIKIN